MQIKEDLLNTGTIHFTLSIEENVKYLKEYLLSIPEFIDNEYLKLYCELIIKNQKKEYIKFETQSHHIIPRAYFKENKYRLTTLRVILLF